MVDAVAALLVVVFVEGVGEALDVAGGEVEAFGACGWYDVGGVACEKEFVPAHGFGDEAAQGGDGFFEAGAGYEALGGFGVEP